MFSNTKTSYGSVAKFFHWIIALLIIGMLIFGYLMTGSFQLNLHKCIGLLILSLAAVRLVWKLLNSPTALPPHNPKIDTILARVVQGLLYICMFGMPLSGWVTATAYGEPPSLYGYRFPMPGVPIAESVADLFQNIHNTIALCLIALVCLHILGALKHFLLDRDGVFETMLPDVTKSLVYKVADVLFFKTFLNQIFNKKP